jgi:hypothetical protein
MPSMHFSVNDMTYIDGLEDLPRPGLERARSTSSTAASN